MKEGELRGRPNEFKETTNKKKWGVGYFTSHLPLSTSPFVVSLNSLGPPIHSLPEAAEVAKRVIRLLATTNTNPRFARRTAIERFAQPVPSRPGRPYGPLHPW